MADRSIRVRLSAEVDGYKRAMAEAAQATEKVSSSVPKAETALGRMVQSAQQNRESWDAAGRSLLVAGGAIVALGTAALKTGIEYNTLQQASRTALTTLLGSAEAANVQMDKLDDFARNSPFAKQVFINAQRQMLGFGIEAAKVIPYLDAIQNAVAATGGSNDDIKELTRIFSQVQAAAKITAVDLMQFGQRGVDAATLIGSQMGKTGAEIRAEITSGSLDAGAALDALAAGMEERFGGAADGVKSTFLGAVDRVKAAWRDLSSELTAPLVDPNGGGALVDFANGMADVMRDFQDLPGPIKATLAGMTGLAGVSALAAGGFLLLAPRVMETAIAYRALSAAHPGVVSGLGATARLASMAATSFVLMQGAGVILSQTVGDVALESNELKGRLDALAESSGDVSQVFGDMRSWTDGNWIDLDLTDLERLQQNLAELADPTPFMSAQTQVAKFIGLFDISELGQYASRLGQVGDELGSMAQSDLPRATRGFTALMEAAGGGRETGLQLLETMPALRDALAGIATSAGLATDDTTLLRIATGDLVPQVEATTQATVDNSEAMEQAAQVFQEWLAMVQAADAAFVDVQGAYDGAIAKNRELAESTAAATESSTDSWEDYYDGVSVSSSDYIAQLQAQVDAQLAWETNMVTIATRVNEGMTGEMRTAARAMLTQLAALGPEGAAQVQLFATMTDEELATVVTLWANRGMEAVTGFTDSYVNLVDPTVNLNVSTTAAYEQITSFMRDVNGRTVYLNAAGQQVGFQTSTGRKGFTEGGYTGDGGIFEPAGVVHGREFVVNARATAANRGTLEAMNRGLPGYLAGGYVSPRYASAVTSSQGREYPTGAPVLSLAGAVLEVRDVDGALIGRMQVEAGRVVSGQVTPLHAGRSGW